MRSLKNEDGIAMVTALMLTLIALAITMALLYLVMVKTRMSGAEKRYKSSYEAGYAAATRLYPKDILPVMINNFTNMSSATTAANSLVATFGNVGLNIPSTTSSTCLKQKVTTELSGWTACSAANKSSDPKVAPDLTFRLRSNETTTVQGFNVYAKIIDNVPGNSDNSGLDLESGMGVVAFSGNPMVKQQPTLYTFEVQGERESNPKEKAIFEVLYAY